jgi:D-sedoheptulose 7-phosphate isomerase
MNFNLYSKSPLRLGLAGGGTDLPNVIQALNYATKNNMLTALWTGNKELNNNYNFNIKIPSKNTAHIQEAHITVGHILCSYCEHPLFFSNDQQ